MSAGASRVLLSLCSVAAILVCMMMVVVVMCDDDPRDDLPWIRVDPRTQHFVDSYGRTILLHGVNAVYKAPPFYPPILDRFDSNHSLSDIDLVNLHDRWGFNVIRLHVAWEAIHPVAPRNMTRRHHDDALQYIAMLRKIVDMCNKRGIYVMLDAHQDLLNRKLCGNGAADWVVNDVLGGSQNFPFPLPFKMRRDKDGYPDIRDCLSHPFFEYYITRDTSRAFHGLFTNVNGVLDGFAEFWALVAKSFRDRSNVLGYDLINEPWFGDIYSQPSLIWTRGKSDRELLMPMYQRLHKEIRTVDDRHIVFYEPMVADIDVIGFDVGPGGREYDDRQALSYHVYCSWNDPSGDPKSRTICKFQDGKIFKWRKSASQRIGGGRFLSEFGALGNTTRSVQELHFVLGEAERDMHSWAYWQFKYYEDITTQVRPGNGESFYDPDGNLYSAKVKALARTYAQATCGVPTRSEFDPISAKYELEYTVQDCQNQPTVIFLSEEYYYPAGYNVEVKPLGAATVVSVPPGNYVHLRHVDSVVRPGDTVTVTITPKKRQ